MPARPQTGYVKQILRLYRQFDIDLLYLFETIRQDLEPVQIQELIKTLMRKSLQNEPLSEDGKAILQSLAYPVDKTTPLLRYRIQYQLQFDKKSDADLIIWLNRIRKGYRNAAVKNLIRHALGTPVLFPSYEDTELHIVASTRAERI